MDASRERLAKKMEERRSALRTRWAEVGKRGGMSPQNLLRIRNGTITITEDAADAIEAGLFWKRGSVDSILAGGEPTELPAPATDPRRRKRKRIDPISSPIEDVNEFLIEIAETEGEEVADELRKSYLRVRALAAQRNRSPVTSGDHEES